MVLKPLRHRTQRPPSDASRQEPPTIGSNLDRPWGKDCFVTLIPIHLLICFNSGYQEVLVSACLGSRFTTCSPNHQATSLITMLAPSAPTITPTSMVSRIFVSSSGSPFPIRSGQPYKYATFCASTMTSRKYWPTSVGIVAAIHQPPGSPVANETTVALFLWAHMHESASQSIKVDEISA